MIFSKILQNVKNNEETTEINIIEENKQFPHSLEVLKHSRNYSTLLNSYVISTQKNIKMKSWFKIIFFFVTMGSMVAIVYFFYLALNYAFDSFKKFDNLNEVSIEAIFSVVTILLPAISSLIVSFIKIPEIIAHYLFNIKEDNNMNLIIKNIQDYDKSMFAMEHKIDEMIMNNKDITPASEDEGIEDSPREDVI